jgi:hypothetical protein
MGGFAKDMIQEHARIAGLCLKRARSSSAM